MNDVMMFVEQKKMLMEAIAALENEIAKVPQPDVPLLDGLDALKFEVEVATEDELPALVAYWESLNQVEETDD